MILFSMEVGICETCILTSWNIYYFPRKWTNSGNLRKNCWTLAEIAEILGEKNQKTSFVSIANVYFHDKYKN